MSRCPNFTLSLTHSLISRLFFFATFPRSSFLFTLTICFSLIASFIRARAVTTLSNTASTRHHAARYRLISHSRRPSYRVYHYSQRQDVRQDWSTCLVAKTARSRIACQLISNWGQTFIGCQESDLIARPAPASPMAGSTIIYRLM